MFCTVLFCSVLKILQCPATAAEGITAKSGPQIDQSDYKIGQNECLAYNKVYYYMETKILNMNVHT